MILKLAQAFYMWALSREQRNYSCNFCPYPHDPAVKCGGKK